MVWNGEQSFGDGCILLGTVGQDGFDGTPRYAFGFRELYSGISFVSVAIGVRLVR